MENTLIGYARCSTDEQDLTAQRQTLLALGVPPDRIYIDHGVSGTKRERPGLDQALAAVGVKQQCELKRMHDTGEYSITDLGELFSVSRPTVYRTINRIIAKQTKARLPARRS